MHQDLGGLVQVDDAPGPRGGPVSSLARVGDRVLVLLDLDSLLASEGIAALPLAA